MIMIYKACCILYDILVCKISEYQLNIHEDIVDGHLNEFKGDDSLKFYTVLLLYLKHKNACNTYKT